MINSSEWVLKVILNRYPPASRAPLETFLSQEERDRLDQMPKAELDTEQQEPPLLNRVHWSWILSILEPLATPDQILYLSALPTSVRKSLSKELKIAPPLDFDGIKIVQDYLIQTLIHALAGDPMHLLPVYFLPPGPLTPLLSLTKQQLIDLIDALSLIDLAVEIRQIVETKILKKIYSFLSEREKKGLKKAANINPQSVLAARLHLEKWDGTEASLRLMLHKRGLARLGIALSQQHPDFTWYVCHQLDVGRGTALAKLAASEVPRNSALAVVHQTEELLKDMT